MRRFTAAMVSVSVAAVVLSCTGGWDGEQIDGSQCGSRRNGNNVECNDRASEALDEGNSGASIDNPLVVLNPEPASINCEFGGTKVTTGRDVNANLSLEEIEVISTQYVCSSGSEVLGTVGGIGSPSLTKTTSEPAGENCASGGIRVDVGLDDDGNGALETLEVDRTTYLCQAQCVLENDRIAVPASVTGSLDYVTGANETGLVPATTADGDVVAWIGFDLGNILSNRAVVGLRLFVRHQQQPDSPVGSPVLRVVHGPAIAFSVDDLGAARMPRGEFLSNRISNIVRDGWNEIPLLLDSNTLEMVSSHHRLSLGLDEVTTPTQSAAFYGASDPSTRPYLEIETVRCASTE